MILSAPIQVMDIGNIMDQKHSMASLQHHHQQGSTPDRHVPQLPQLTARNLSEVPMDRAGSPHGSEHSRYSAPRHLDSAPRSYPSPGPMGAGHMSMASNGQQHIAPPVVTMILPGGPPNMAQGMHQFKAPDASLQQPQQHTQQQTKAYPCTTCGKRFARRSDLARHGKSMLKPGPSFHRLTMPRTHPLRCSPSCVRLARMRQAVHSTLCPYSPPTCSYWREASHVRALRQGAYCLA